MAKLKKQEFRELADKWMKSQGWRNEQELLQHLIFEYRIEEERYLPMELYSNDGEFFLTYFFDKENYFPSRKTDKYTLEKYIDKWITGFDDWKYEYIKMYEILFHFPSAVIFYNETEKEFAFRPILELGNPYKTNWKDSQFHKDLEVLRKSGRVYASPEYREGLRHAVDRLFRNRTGKNKGMVVWDIQKLGNNTSHNKRLFI
jgi:hypothetical protein